MQLMGFWYKYDNTKQKGKNITLEYLIITNIVNQVVQNHGKETKQNVQLQDTKQVCTNSSTSVQMKK